MILLTGGAGFIGSKIAHNLSSRGADVTVCDRFGDSPKWRNIRDLKLANIVVPEFALQGKYDAVIHMGAVSSTEESNTGDLLRENFEFSKKLWNHCTAHKIPFIYASSAAVYGDGPFDDAHEKTHTLKPLSAYGWSKKLFDSWAIQQAMNGWSPIQWNGLRFFNVYGPGETHKGRQASMVSQVLWNIREGQQVALYDVAAKRDFVWVGDCVRVVLWCLDKQARSGIYNVGTGQATDFRDMAVKVMEQFRHLKKIKSVQMPAELTSQYQYHTQADISRLRSAGYKEPFVTPDEGVAMYCAVLAGVQ